MNDTKLPNDPTASCTLNHPKDWLCHVCTILAVENEDPDLSLTDSAEAALQHAWFTPCDHLTRRPCHGCILSRESAWVDKYAQDLITQAKMDGAALSKIKPEADEDGYCNSCGERHRGEPHPKPAEQANDDKQKGTEE